MGTGTPNVPVPGSQVHAARLEWILQLVDLNLALQAVWAVWRVWAARIWVQNQQYIKIYHDSSQELEIRGCTLNLVAKHR